MIMVIAQARMQSTRLPGKVLKTIEGRSLLDFHISRLKRSKKIHKIVVATSDLPADNPIEEACKTLGVDVVRGAESDVLGRYGKVLEAFPDYNTIIRTTCDCPLIDPELVDELIAFYHENQPLGYANITSPLYPRGMDAEIFSTEDLNEAAKKASSPFEREHVTPYIRNKHGVRSLPATLKNCDFRWCVDEIKDFECVEAIVAGLANANDMKFGWRDCLAVVHANPKIAKINAKIMQKTH